jgi:hypothetical protein
MACRFIYHNDSVQAVPAQYLGFDEYRAMILCPARELVRDMKDVPVSVTLECNTGEAASCEPKWAIEVRKPTRLSMSSTRAQHLACSVRATDRGEERPGGLSVGAHLRRVRT